METPGGLVKAEVQGKVPLAYLQCPSIRRQVTLHKSKRLYEAGKVAAQLNLKKEKSPNHVPEETGAGNKAPKIEKAAQLNLKKEETPNPVSEKN